MVPKILEMIAALSAREVLDLQVKLDLSAEDLLRMIQKAVSVMPDRASKWRLDSRFCEKRISAIKWVREFGGVSLREAKDVVDGTTTLDVGRLYESTRQELREKLEDLGVKILEGGGDPIRARQKDPAKLYF